MCIKKKKKSKKKKKKSSATPSEVIKYILIYQHIHNYFFKRCLWLYITNPESNLFSSLVETIIICFPGYYNSLLTPFSQYCSSPVCSTQNSQYDFKSQSNFISLLKILR